MSESVTPGPAINPDPPPSPYTQMRDFLEKAFPGIRFSERMFSKNQDGAPVKIDKSILLRLSEEQRVLLKTVGEVTGMSVPELQWVAISSLLYLLCTGKYLPMPFMEVFCQTYNYQPVQGESTHLGQEKYQGLHLAVSQAYRERAEYLEKHR